MIVNIDTEASPAQLAKWLTVAKGQRERTASKLEADFGSADNVRTEVATLGAIIQQLLTLQTKQPKRS